MVRADPPVSRPAGVEVDVNVGPAAAYEGLRRALDALREAGATFDDVRGARGPEWAELFPRADGGPGTPLAEIALAASERRLHRESEQVFRVLSTAAAALCRGCSQVGRPLVLHGVGGADLPSLRGFMRAAEHARTLPGAGIVTHAPERVRPPLDAAADLRAERACCLRGMGLAMDAGDLRAELPAPAASPVPPASREGELYALATDPDADAADRLAAVLGYCRAAFFSANWEGTAVVASTALRLAEHVADARVPGLLQKARLDDEQAEAIEFEPGALETAVDLRAFLYKVLGVQATFRGRQDEALTYFRAMREGTGRLLPELRAQSHLYCALTLSKRMDRVGDAIGELDEGFSAVGPRDGEADSLRRERGWLHNLRGLTHFARGELRAAFEREKLALACIEGLGDPSSVHLRINLLSNVSVLQEKAGRHQQAARTWERFKKAGGSSNTAFVKHHAYRAAGLALLTGDRVTALDELDRSLGCAGEFADDFHECEIRLELGGLHVRAGEDGPGAAHFTAAGAAATRLGDPYRMALAKAGLAVCSNTPPGDEVTRLAGLSLANAGKAGELRRSVSSAQDPRALLPTPRTKLNRPFDLVNFQGRS
ncbi:hypothetical protein AGRA3207_006072 [Actinomadura graeca]|uniref:Tetratricopeptide repeat protein n=1 Tax=Actinomadura graeca TaxID=2750812 RepID=A0ABX8R0Z7_9ACTN|nr:hypothetical protein [Actinomadura graeca]QXJ24695.1 hypothetical protein AGRA3207_006072 [Actinomadura graeca]